MRLSALVVAILALSGAGCGGEEPSERRTRARATDRPDKVRVRARPERGRESVRRAPVPAGVRRAVARMSLGQRVAQVFLVPRGGRDRPWGAILVSSLDEAAVIGGPRVVPLIVASEPGPGVELVLGPSLDVMIGEEEGPAAVARRGRTSIAALRRAGAVAAPGKFPGQGAATQDPLDGPSVVSLPLDILRERDLVPFRALIARMRAVVVSSAAFTAYDAVIPAALNPRIARDLLRGELGFEGAALSDDLAGAATIGATTVGVAAVRALRAGIDLLQVPDPAEVEPAYAAVLAAVRDGTIPRARLREAAERVLVLKSAAR